MNQSGNHQSIMGCFPCARLQIANGNSASRRIVVPNGAAAEPATEAAGSNQRNAQQQHLVFMVNGILGSAENWEFAATKFRERFDDEVVVHCSACNACCDTLHGLDVMGRRLADEVREVVKQYPAARKISFVAHSLGGLVARYAIAELYKASVRTSSGAASNAAEGPADMDKLAEANEAGHVVDVAEDPERASNPDEPPKAAEVPVAVDEGIKRPPGNLDAKSTEAALSPVRENTEATVGPVDQVQKIAEGFQSSEAAVQKGDEAPEAAVQKGDEVPEAVVQKADVAAVQKADEAAVQKADEAAGQKADEAAGQKADEVPRTVEAAVDEVQRSAERGTIAGLEPCNFITVATPHLGSRGHWQLPFLFGIKLFEKMAVWIAPVVARRTGSHLFLTDGRKDQPPLLRSMVTDCKDGMFMSALRSFKRHVAYANTTYDHVVGRRTASIRRESEMPEKQKHVPLDPKYPHIVSVEEVVPENVEIALKSPVVEEAIAPALNPIEEEMIVALTQIRWERVDVCFHGFQRLFSHSTIQVKSYPFYSEGADVIEHIIDNFLL